MYIHTEYFYCIYIYIPNFAAARPRMDVLWNQMGLIVMEPFSLRPSRGECNGSVEGRAVFST